MWRFAQKNRVVYVEPRIPIRRCLRYWRSGKYPFSVIYRDLVSDRMESLRPALFRYRNPVLVPSFDQPTMGQITLSFWQSRLKRHLERYGMRNKTIVWLSRPNMIDYTAIFDDPLVIYHVVDEYLAYGSVKDVYRSRLERIETGLLKKADLVLVVSENLYSRKRIHNRHTYLVPNAVDYDLYQKVMLSSQPPPEDIRGINPPIVGYSGLISSRLDLGIIAYLAESRPDWSVVLIGSTWEKNCGRQLERLRACQNVFFLGRKPIEMVPHYIKAFDVGIIPYTIGEQSEHISPLKLYDYFAAGKPVVTTRFPAATGFASLVCIADTKESFATCIENELERKDDSKRFERIHVASGNTWNDRVEQISEIITGHLKRKQLAERI